MGLGSVLGNIGSAITGRRPSVMTPPFLMSPQQQPPQPPLTNPPSMEDDPDQQPLPDALPPPKAANGIGATIGSAGPMTVPPAAGGSYTTKLTPNEEAQFQSWVKATKAPWQDDPDADYDMRGYWKALQTGDPNAKQSLSNGHYPDTYKTPYHKTFSNESKYATPDAPHWEGDRLIDKSGRVIADESAGAPSAATPPPTGLGATAGNAGPMTAPSPGGSPAAAPAPAVKAPSSNPLPVPPALPNTDGGQHIGLGRKILGAAVEGASYLMPPAVPLGHMLGQKLSMGGDYLTAKAKYDQQMANREAQADLENKIEGTAGLKDQRLATAEQRRALGKDYEARETERQNKITADKEIATAKQKQAQYAVKVKGRENSVIPILPGETAPPGWQVIEHPDGGQVAMPPSLTTIPDQLLPYFPGRKTGDIIGMGEYEKANQIYRETLKAKDIQDNKAPKDVNAVQLAIRAAGGDPDNPASITPAIAQKASQILKPPSAAGAGVTLTPEAMDYWARFAGTTGTLPSLGMGSAGAKAREQILNRAPQVVGGDVASNRASNRADAGSLANIQKMRDSVVSFENTALANLNLFTKQAKSVVDSGSPLVNTPLRAINRSLLGSNEVAAYDAARQVALTEIAKVVNNPNLSGQLSDSARKEVTGLIPENATLGQIYHVVEILKQDMANRHKYLDQSLGEIKGRMGGGSGGGGTQPKADPLGIR